MPLVGFRPTKARLVMEHARPSVLVLKVALDDDAVALATGGTLAELAGVLRVREARADAARAPGNGTGEGDANGNGHAGAPARIGALTYVAESGDDAAAAPAKFQVEVTMPADKFAQLLRAINAGRMPTRFMVDAGSGARGLDYRIRGQRREKWWDNASFRVLPVTNFVMILPLDLAAEDAAAPAVEASAPWATNAQVAEMMDDMLTFQSDTRNTMFGLVCVLAVVALASLVLAILAIFR